MWVNEWYYDWKKIEINKYSWVLIILKKIRLNSDLYKHTFLRLISNEKNGNNSTINYLNKFILVWSLYLK